MAAKASKPTHLRPVEPGDEPAGPLSLSEAVRTGDYRTILVAQRAEIADTIPATRGPAKAALHRQLSLISKELAEMDGQAHGEAGQDGLEGDESWDEAAI